MQREQEPQWDPYYDTDMDNITLPDDDTNWEDMSQLSALSEDSGQHKQDLNSNHQQSQSKGSSSSANMDVDPPRESSMTRPKISLRAPQSQQKRQQGESTASVQDEFNHVFHGKPKPSTDSSGAIRDNTVSAQDFFSLSNRSSPRQDITGAGQNKFLQKKAPSDSPIQDFPTDDSGYNDCLDSYDLSRGGTPIRVTERVKRRVSPGQDSDEDFSTNRRRSRSFPKLPLAEDTTAKINVGMDSKQLTNAGVEKTDTVTGNMNEVPEKGHWNQSRNDMSLEKTVGSDVFSVKIKTEIMSTKSPGVSDPVVIDLSSDDDGCDGHTMKIKTEPQIKTGSQDTAVLWAKATSLHGHNFTLDHGSDSDGKAYIKQEETLLEFDMDDEAGFDGLSHVASRIPEVELAQVKEAMQAKREVRAVVSRRFIGCHGG